MRAKFDFTGTTQLINVILPMVTLLAVFIVGYSDNKLLLLLLCAAFFSVTRIISSFHGEIIADEKRITIVTTFWGKNIRKKYIEYGDVDCADCGVETFGNRWGSVFHTIKFTIKLKNISEFTVSDRLDIEANFPAEQPEKYRQYLDEQPLMQISNYINNKLNLNTSA